MIPATAFASIELATDPPQEIFRSSGTLGGTPETGRSVHRHPFPGLYRAAIDASFPRFCLRAGLQSDERSPDLPAMLSLVPPRGVTPDSSLGFMVEHLLRRFGGPGSDYAFGERGVEGVKARSWCGARQREGRPVMILGTSFALADLVDFLGRIGLKFRLPAGSVVFETGGFKGRARGDLAPGAPSPARGAALHRAGVDRRRIRHDRAHQPVLHRDARRRRSGNLRPAALDESAERSIRSRWRSFRPVPPASSLSSTSRTSARRCTC